MKVLITVRRSTATSNPYVDLLQESFGPETSVVRFTYGRAVFGRYDVLHVQWPEYIFRGSTPLKAIVKAVPGLALLLRLWLFRVPVVATVHNESAHEPPGLLERVQVALLARLTVLDIYLNEAETNDMGRGVVILHGDYPSYGEARRGGDRGDSRLLFFGQVRPYKGVEDLIRATRDQPGVHLRIAGLALDPAYADSLRALTEGLEGVELDFGHLSDQRLDEDIRASDLVVLPYKRMYNSGAVLLALGNGTPVLVPSSSSTRALADEVGHEWVTLFDAPVKASDVLRARQSVLSIDDDERPDLSRRDRRVIGILHERLYGLVLDRRGSSRRLWREQVLRRVAVDDDFGRHSERNRTV